MSYNHPQIEVDHNGQKIHIDENIAELIKLIWKNEIETMGCCEGDNETKSYIHFKYIEDLQKFLNIVAQYPDKSHPKFFQKSLYARITGDEYGVDNKWEYEIGVINLGIRQKIIHHDAPENCLSKKGKECVCLEGDTEIIEEYLGHNDFIIYPIVRFPKSDIPLLVQILNK